MFRKVHILDILLPSREKKEFAINRGVQWKHFECLAAHCIICPVVICLKYDTLCGSSASTGMVCEAPGPLKPPFSSKVNKAVVFSLLGRDCVSVHTCECAHFSPSEWPANRAGTPAIWLGAVLLQCPWRGTLWWATAQILYWAPCPVTCTQW